MSLELGEISSFRRKNGAECVKTSKTLCIQESPLAGDQSLTYCSRKGKERLASSTGPTDLPLLSAGLSTGKKRGNKRTLFNSVADERKQCGEVVEVEGMLVVAEQVDRGQTLQNPPVFRTLGSIHCILVRKSMGLFLETASKECHHTIMLNMDVMDLVHKPLEIDYKFQLRYRHSELKEGFSWQRASSYTFMTLSKEEHVMWLNGILRHQASDIGRDQISFMNEPMTGVGAVEVGPARQSADLDAESEDQQQKRQMKERHEQPQPSLDEFIYPTPPRTKHFILVRHGHYINANVPQVLDSQQVLSQMGRQQAELTGNYLGVAHNRTPTRHDVSIYHSDMTRAVETAAIIATDFEEVSLNSSSLLREGWPGAPYSIDFTVRGGATAARSSDVVKAMQQQSCVDTERMGKAFDWFLFNSHKTYDEDDEESYCVLVCHANLIRFFLCRALGVDPATTWGHFEINHCGVTRIDVCTNRPIKIIAVNETGHLPQSLITSSEDHL